MKHNRSTLMTTCLAAAILAVGCHQSGTDTSAPPNQVAPTTGTSAEDAPDMATPRNACALVDLAALEAIAGEKLSMLNDVEGTNQTTCELTSLQNETALIYVTVHWKGGKDLVRVDRAAQSMAHEKTNDGEPDIDELTGSEEVRGLADKAFYSDVMPSWVLKGDVLIEIISPRFNHDKTHAVFMSVAESALPKL